MLCRRSLWFAVVGLLAVGVAVQAAEVPAASQLSWADAILAKPPGTVVPPAPDPNVIAQGGDTCASATVISALPYTDDGTTAGYTNDYDEVCPYSGSTSPDVVYAYTPAANTSVDVTLCTGTTNYDTKLFVYQGTCASGTSIACNDDNCTAPLFSSPYVSSLSNIPLTGGQTYYFVVDGYGGGSGNYTISITEWQPPPPPAECDGPDLLYYQTVMGPSDSWNAFTSGETATFNYTVFDNFTSTSYSITDFHWWGLSLLYNAGWSACDPTGMTFDVAFYTDNAGQPGTQVCSYAGVAPTGVAGASYAGYPLYYWDVTGLTPACEPTGATWVAVHSHPNTAGCVFLWMSGTGGDSACWQYDASTSTYTAQVVDVSMCVTGTLVPVELQSFSAQ